MTSSHWLLDEVTFSRLFRGTLVNIWRTDFKGRETVFDILVATHMLEVNSSIKLTRLLWLAETEWAISLVYKTNYMKSYHFTKNKCLERDETFSTSAMVRSSALEEISIQKGNEPFPKLLNDTNGMRYSDSKVRLPSLPAPPRSFMDFLEGTSIQWQDFLNNIR